MHRAQCYSRHALVMPSDTCELCSKDFFLLFFGGLLGLFCTNENFVSFVSFVNELNHFCLIFDNF